MNRRKFFKAAASFVAGCAIGLGMRPKIEPFPHLIPAEYVHQVKVTPDYVYMVFFDKDLKSVDFMTAESVRSFTYRCVDGKWQLHESTRKA